MESITKFCCQLAGVISFLFSQPGNQFPGLLFKPHYHLEINSEAHQQSLIYQAEQGFHDILTTHCQKYF